VTVYVMPDTLEVVQGYLLSVAEVTALVGTRVRVNTTDTTWPSVRISALTSVEAVPRRLDRSLIQVDCWAAPPDSTALTLGDETAQLVARTVKAALVDIAGYVHPEQRPDQPWMVPTAVVTGCDTPAIRYQPDDSREPVIPRWVVSAAIYLRPNP